MISISCLESKLLNNNNWYGRFQLAPFQKGEGLTVANALRRTLLAEKSNFFITWVDFYNAEIPYSVLTGMRESIFDILLNLKQIIFTSDKILPNNSHFLKTLSNNNLRPQKRFFSSLREKNRFFPECVVGFQHAGNPQGSAGRFSLPFLDVQKRDAFFLVNTKNKAPGLLFSEEDKMSEAMGWDPTNKFNLEPKINFLNKFEYGLNLTSDNLIHRTNQKNQDLIIDQKIHLKISKRLTNSLFSMDKQKKGINETLGLQNYKNRKTDPKIQVLPDLLASLFETSQKGTRDFWYSPKTTLQAKPWDETSNVFGQNQILGKTMNSKNQAFSLVPIGIFPKNINRTDQFLDSYNSKEIGNSTYLGYICVKGPTTIYAKNIKLPKGLKCVDPNKYIATLADDGLFYLRFALTTEITTLPLNNTSNVHINIHKSIQFNKVRLKTFPKTLFNKEIESVFSSRFNAPIRNLQKNTPFYNSIKGGRDLLFFPSLAQGTASKKKQQHLNTSQIYSFDDHYKQKHDNSKTNLILTKPVQLELDVAKPKLPFFFFKSSNAMQSKKPLHFGSSYTKSNHFKMRPVNYTKRLINEQRLILTNDSIKQLNFQNTSIIANIQKTCLLNLQIKHYYYKCGRFDRFLFDLIKPFKPSLKSIHYNKPSLKIKENVFFQDTDWKRLTRFQKIALYQNYNNQRLMNYKQNNFKPSILKDFKDYLSGLRDKNGFYPERVVGVQHAINQQDSTCNFSFGALDIQSTDPFFLMNTKKRALDEAIEWKMIRNQYFGSLVKWQKTFKSIRTSYIYDYLYKLHISETTLRQWPEGFFLLTQPDLKSRVSLLSSKWISNISFQIGSSLNKEGISLWMSGLHEPYIEKRLKGCFSFQCSKNHILYCLKSYILQYNNSLNKNSIRVKNTLADLQLKPDWIYSEKLITRIKFLRKWLSLSTKQNKETKILLSKKKTYLLPLINRLFFLGRVNLLEFFCFNQSKTLKCDNYLREFFVSGFRDKNRFYPERVIGFQHAENQQRSVFPSISISQTSTGLISSGLREKNRFFPECVVGFQHAGNPQGLTCHFNTSEATRPEMVREDNMRKAMTLGPKQDNIYEEMAQKANRYETFLKKPSLKGTTNDSFTISTHVRIKPFNSIQQVSYKPVWIFPCQFLQNGDNLSRWLRNRNLPDYEQAQTRKNFFWNPSCFTNERNKTPFKIKTSNSVVLKPIYLNVEQIIYILKQTTKFHKNQRINPVFFNDFNKTNFYPLDYSFLFPKPFHSFHNSLSNASLFNNITQTKHLSFINNKALIQKKNIHKSQLLCHVWVLRDNFVFKNNSLNRGLNKAKRSKFITSIGLISGFFQKINRFSWTEDVEKKNANLNRASLVEFIMNFRVKLNPPASGSLYASILSPVIHYNRFIKKYRVFNTYDFIDNFKLSIPTRINVSRGLLYFGINANIKRKSLISKISEINKDINSFSLALKRHLIINRYFSLLDVDYKSKIKNFYNEPYNINVYHSKISFNLRYNHPFKYTIFETRLAFLNSSEKVWDLPKTGLGFLASQSLEKIDASVLKTILLNRKTNRKKSFKLNRLIQNLNNFSFFRNQDFEKIRVALAENKKYQIINSHGKNTQILNSKIVSSHHFDYIQYNESFKIYTTLAYACLKTYEPYLPKYHNFNRQNQKKSQPISSHTFDSLIEPWETFQNPNNNENRSFNTKYPKLDYKKSSVYEFSNISEQLPSIFNNSSKWRIINNSNFNDAFIVIPRNWPLNFQFYVLPNLTNLVYSFLAPLQKLFFINFIAAWDSFENKNPILFLDPINLSRGATPKNLLAHVCLDLYDKQVYNFFEEKIGILKNKLHWLKSFQVNTKNYDNNGSYNSKKSSFLISKLKIKSSFKKLAMSFETLYYKNFLWNSRKITLRVLNNAVLPLVTHRKYSIYDFTPKKNSQASTHLSDSLFEKSQKETRDFWCSPKRMLQAKGWGETQKLAFYSVRHKILETTNFMCFETYPTFKNQNEIQTQAFGKKTVFIPKALGDSSMLESPKAPTHLSASSLETSQKETRDFWSSPKTTLHAKRWGGTQKTFKSDYSIRVPRMSIFENKLSNTNVSSINSDKIQMLNSKDSSKNDSKMTPPFIRNLWSSSFFCSYSQYAISTKSDLFLQNLISISGLADQNTNVSVSSEEKNMETSDSSTLVSKQIDISQALPDASASLFETSQKGRRDFWYSPKTTLQAKRWNETQNNPKAYKRNLEEANFFKRVELNSKQSNGDQFLNIKPFLKSSYHKTVQKILKSQHYKSIDYFVPNYDFHWQKRVYFAILREFKTPRLNNQREKIGFNWSKSQYNDQFFLQYPKKNIDYASQNLINLLKNKHSIRRLKNYERYFGIPLRRPLNQKGLGFYKIKLLTKLPKEFTTLKLKKTNQQIIKPWKSIIWTAEVDTYFVFGYPLFIQNSNLPWQKSKYLFSIPKDWLNRITQVNLQSLSKLRLWFMGFSNSLLKYENINGELNTHLFMSYTQLSSSFNKTHQPLLYNKTFKNVLLPIHLHMENKGSYKMIGYFTINESLNSTYKVNYIVESQALESKSLSDLTRNSNQNNRVMRFPNLIEGFHNMQKFENLHSNYVATDSLTVSNFLNGTYSFVPSKDIILNSFNDSINSKINKSQIENDNEYIQIDIWTNGELSPRQALLNAFRKLFELFYNLSKYNCLKPIEI